MLTTRLSEVITGCGAKLTTCSRRSTRARTWSTNGIRKCGPASSVREYLPSRSTISAVACGTMRIALLMAEIVKITNRPRTMRPMTSLGSTRVSSIEVGRADPAVRGRVPFLAEDEPFLADDERCLAENQAVSPGSDG